MKKILAIILGLVLALTAACALGEAPAADPLHEHLAKLGETPYTLATLEYDVMTPKNAAVADIFVGLLNDMTVKPSTAQAPDGIYVVLAFPEEKTRFDFFLNEAEKNLFRYVKADGTEEMYEATVPEGRANIANVMESWADSVADELGLAKPVEAKMPDPGWILDSVNGKVWADDRASLEVYLEDTENYKVLITWASSAWETTEWTYACDYKAEDQTLHAVRMIREDVVYDDKGNENRTIAAEKDVEAVFALNAEGKVVLTGAGDEQLEGKTFEAVPGEQVEAAWTIAVSNAVTEELQAEFDAAVAKLMGAKHTALAYLGSDGTVDCFFCRSEAVVPDAVPYYTLVYINEKGVQNIYDIWIGAHAE